MKYMKRGGKNKASNKKKLYQTAGKKELGTPKIGTDAMKGQDMRYNFLDPDNPVPNTKESQDRAKKQAAERKTNSYAEAKKRNPNLDKLIKQRKGLKKGTPDYNKVQNQINKAYGKGPVNRDEGLKKMELAKTPLVKNKVTKPGIAKSTGTIKSGNKPVKKATPAAKGKTTGFFTSKAEKDLASLKDMGMQESKEIKFDSPSGKEKRQAKRAKGKAKRQAVKAVRRSMKKMGDERLQIMNYPKLAQYKGGGKKDACYQKVKSGSKV